MKLAIKVYFATLILLTLTFAAFAQSDARSDKDPRNTMPTVGTGGAIGGPTGLFTVYDGQTLRRGEFTLSLALSNYDRDPGNVDITSYPASFQVGLTNHLELFFTTEAYRQVKVNSPRNLSSFYLPNSQFVFPGFGLTRPPAIVLSPQGPGVSQYPNMAIFRPTGAPYAVFPYTGQNAGTFGLQAPFFSGPVFGFAANTNATYGPPRLGSGNGADLFPGVGSVYGSILPGIVLRTQPLLNLAGAVAGEAPAIFTLAPSYLPDAPFVNHRVGDTSFNDATVGFKWRMTSLNNPIGFGVIGAYTYSMNRATDANEFLQMNRGAGGSGKFGDVSVTLFADARVARWANISANVGYKYTTKIKSDFGGTTYTLLDRPDELSSSIGVDFPVNRWFQPIAEFRSLAYVGGRTPNAFENNPIDGIIGARIFPTRWTTIGLAYRYNFNQQGADSFDSDQTFTGSVVVPCRPGVTACTPVTLTNTFKGVPPGFDVSTDPHGYILQLAIGRRNKRQGDIVNIPAVINSVNLSATTIKLGCPAGTVSESGCNDSRTINVTTSASDAENDVLTYNYTVSGGRIVGTGANVQWDLSGATAGTYTITTGVDDGCGVCGQTNTQTVTVAECNDCKPKCDCATLSVQGPGGVTDPGATMTFTLSGARSNPVNWTVSAGTIESGQGTSSITVRTTSEMASGNVTATAEISGTDPACNCQTSASETAAVAGKPVGNMVDEFGPQKDDEVKARVDNFYIQLNNDPNAKGYIVNYGTAKQIAARKAQILKAIKFRKYDANRVVFVDGGDTGSGVNTKFWLVPAGAEPPTN